jgi:hypothetical protein
LNFSAKCIFSSAAPPCNENNKVVFVACVPGDVVVVEPSFFHQGLAVLAHHGVVVLLFHHGIAVVAHHGVVVGFSHHEVWPVARVVVVVLVLVVG